MQQCKYKNLKKPTYWKIILFLDLKKESIENNSKKYIKAKTSYKLAELAKELNMDIDNLRKVLVELEEQGHINMIKIKGRLQVLL